MKNWLLTNLSNLFVIVTSILSPSVPLILTIGFLVMVDMAFAIYSAHKRNIPITSKKMGNTISKLFLYTLTIISVHCLEKYIIGPILPITKIAAGLIGLVEIKSILETFETLTGINIWDSIKDIVIREKTTTK
jgi:hypothetical protein